MIFKNFVLKIRESLKKNLVWMLHWRTRFVIFMTFSLMYRIMLSLPFSENFVPLWWRKLFLFYLILNGSRGWMKMRVHKLENYMQR
jgi:hypothetical protein